ncbi:MAG: alpha/beta hydrolase [Candidatus Ozemobacteraceae bacterium]
MDCAKKIVPFVGEEYYGYMVQKIMGGLRRRGLLLAGLSVLFLGLLVYVGLVNLLIRPPTWLEAKHVQASDDGAIPFQAENPEGKKIAAWFYEGLPGKGIVIFCHGHGVDHYNFLPMLQPFRNMGLGLIFFDFRAHGTSQGSWTSVGLREWEDLRAVIDAARRLGFISGGQHLAAYGRSMGAAVLANGSSHLADIQAFILESCFAELRLVAGRDVPRLSGIPDFFWIDAVFAGASWYTGYDYSNNRPVDAVVGIGKRPTLLIHDEADLRALRQDFDNIHQKLPQASIMIVPGAPHVRAFTAAPAFFLTTVRNFLLENGFDPL